MDLQSCSARPVDTAKHNIKVSLIMMQVQY